MNATRDTETTSTVDGKEQVEVQWRSPCRRLFIHNMNGKSNCLVTHRESGLAFPSSFHVLDDAIEHANFILATDGAGLDDKRPRPTREAIRVLRENCEEINRRREDAEFKELTARDSDADFEAWLETEAGKSAIERAAMCCATAGSDPSRALGLVRAEWNGFNSLVRNLR